MKQSDARVKDQPEEQPVPVAKPANATVTPALEYDRTPNHVTRGQFRIFLVLLFINTVAIVGYLVAPNGFTFARQVWRDFENKRAAKANEAKRIQSQQKVVADFRAKLPAIGATTLPSDVPVYTEDPIEAASLLASDAAYETVKIQSRSSQSSIEAAWQPAVGRARPTEASTLAGVMAIRNEGLTDRPVTALLRACKNPAGADRLVWCELDVSQSAESVRSNEIEILTFRNLRVRLIHPGTEGRFPYVLRSVVTIISERPEDRSHLRKDGESKTPQIFRLSAGSADAKDPTRLTVPYRLNGAEGAFVIRVEPDDRLSVEPSDGRITERTASGSNTSQKWSSWARPATGVDVTQGQNPVTAGGGNR